VLHDISLDIEGITAKAEEKKGFLSKIPILRAIGSRVDEYNRALHGPLVDLSFNPRPGVEQIEVYAVNEPYAYIRVIYDHSTREYTYEVLEPLLSPAELELLQELKARIFERLEINTRDVVTDFARMTLKRSIDEIVSDFGIRLSPVQRAKILYHMDKEFPRPWSHRRRDA